MSDNADLKYVAVADTTDYEGAMDRIVQKTVEAANATEEQGVRIADALSFVPEIDFDVLAKAGQSLDTISVGFAEIDDVISKNKKGISELQDAYNKLTQEQKQALKNNASEAELEGLAKQKKAIEENIALRQKTIDAAQVTYHNLIELEQQLKAAQDAATSSNSQEAVVESASQVSVALTEEQQKLNDISSAIERLTSTSQTSSISQQELKQIQEQIAQASQQNNDAITNLQLSYAQLEAQATKAVAGGLTDDYNLCLSQQVAISGEIEMRKALNKTLTAQGNTISNLTKKIVDNKTANDSNAAGVVTMKSRLKELQIQLQQMEASKLNGGVFDPAKFKQLQAEAAALKDQIGDTAAQVSILSNDQKTFQGLISGLSGISGAASAAQGAMSLFGAANEDVQQVMLKVQSLMSITIGLQQVSTMLNKDSAASLVLFAGVKSMFNKLFYDTVAIEQTENAEKTESIALTTEETVVTEENTAIQEANAAAREQVAGAALGQAEATSVSTGASQSNTVALGAQTEATVGLDTATKATGKTLKLFRGIIASTGIGLLVVGLIMLAQKMYEMFTATSKADKEFKEQQELMKSGREAYLKTKTEIENYTTQLSRSNLTKKEEKHLVQELNSKLGERMGYHKKGSEWLSVLKKKGEAYCQMLMIEAEAQAYLNKYVEAHIDLLETQDKARRGDFNKWYRTKAQDQRAADKKVQEAQDKVDKYEKKYRELMSKIQDIKDDNDFNFHADPNKGGTKFDPKQAALTVKNAIAEFEKQVKEFMKQSSQSIFDLEISLMKDGLTKRINEIHKQVQQQILAEKERFRALAEARKKELHDIYMSQKGATEVKWSESAAGKKTIEQYIDEIIADPKFDKLTRDFKELLERLKKSEAEQIADARQEYIDGLIDDFGTVEQRSEKLTREWGRKIAFIPAEFLPQAIKKMEEEFSQLKIEDFKKNINWDAIFGNLSEQSLSSLRYSLDKVKAWFEQAKNGMTVTEIKDFQQAITSMENEIASRNPFTAMHKSFKDISSAKDEFVAAMSEMKASQEALTQARNEYNAVFREENDLRGKVNDADRSAVTNELVEARKKELAAIDEVTAAEQNLANVQAQIDNGELAADCQELTDAQNQLAEAQQARTDAEVATYDAMELVDDAELVDNCLALADAQTRLAKSQSTLASANERNAKAENNALTARNKITKSYKNFANNLRAAGNVATDVGKKASKLARVFSDDIADSMDKALDCIDEVMDATSDIISAIGDVGKSVAKGVEATVDGVAQGTQATAAAAATSISTVEKASVILTVISAALTIATAIANLFNNDDAKQKEIEKLQERIDQLQWELDNQDAVRLQKNVGNALEQLKKIYAEARDEVLRLHGVMQNSSQWVKWLTAARYEGDIYAKTVEKIADYWAKAGYTADKALGNERYNQSRKQLENLAEQQLLIQKQMNEESSKKKSDSGKIQDYKNKIAELAEEMATLINDMLEDIIGQSAEDIAKTLGDAFFEAVKSGEDAMEAWHKKVNEIVADIMQRMLIQKFLEQPLGEIFDKYKKRWFGDDGRFKGIDSIINSMGEFSNDIDAVGATFQQIMNELPDSVKQWFSGDEEREASQRGIATASQDSVDENNARLTTIQSHTYTLVQGVAELNATGTQMLDKLANIDDNTGKSAESLEAVQTDIKRLKGTLEDIQTQGLKLKS